MWAILYFAVGAGIGCFCNGEVFDEVMSELDGESRAAVEALGKTRTRCVLFLLSTVLWPVLIAGSVLEKTNEGEKR